MLSSAEKLPLPFLDLGKSFFLVLEEGGICFRLVSQYCCMLPILTVYTVGKYGYSGHDFSMCFFLCVPQDEMSFSPETELKISWVQEPLFVCKQGLPLITLLRSLWLKRNFLCWWALAIGEVVVLKAALSVSKVVLHEGLKSACSGCSDVFWLVLNFASW